MSLHNFRRRFPANFHAIRQLPVKNYSNARKVWVYRKIPNKFHGLRKKVNYENKCNNTNGT